MSKFYNAHFFLFALIINIAFSVCAYAEITLAVIAPKVGKLKSVGDELFNGAQIAIDEINKAGGLNDEKLDLLTIDDRCDDRLALSTAGMLTLLKSKKIALVVGPYCANRFEETSNIYEKAGIFQIVPTTLAYNSGTIDKKGQILLLGTKSQMSKDFFSFYNANFAGLKVGCIYNDSKDSGFTEAAQTLASEFKRFGKSSLLKFYSLNQNKEDLKDTIIKENIDIILVLGNHDETVDFLDLLLHRTKNKFIFTNKRILNADDLENYKKETHGIYLMGLPGLKDSLLFTESLVDLRLSGIEPKGLEAYSYVAIKLWSDLVKNAKSFQYNRLVSTLNKSETKEKWSEFLMHSGSLNSAHYTIELYKNNEIKQVY